MWIFSLMMLMVALVFPFAMTAAAGFSVRDIRSRRRRLTAMFCFGVLIYVGLVGLMTLSAWFHNAENLPSLFGLLLVIWGIPLASSGLSVWVFWGQERPEEESSAIGFSPS